MLKQSLIAKTTPVANKEQVTTVGDVRITVLTPRLIRVEKGETTDLASFAVLNRQFPGESATVKGEGNTITVETSEVIFTVKGGKPYSATFKDSGETRKFSSKNNLKGTRRTLDFKFGAVSLDDGLISKDGVCVMDDSKSVLLDESGHFLARNKGVQDYYAFAYGKDYRATLKAFYTISGVTPLVPRYALGVWWSRYHAYTQKEYIDLVDRFEKENVPLTVATVDMDWHWVKGIKEKFGVDYRGWTGYSWNTDLFPDYRKFLKDLKDRNLHTTLNLHPADGVFYFEDMYEDMAKACGIDPATKEKVPFACSSDDFWNGYFDILHKPYEREGVDFWWIDWQQGTKSDVKGVDPLNMLNHYHFLDNAEDGRMPLILSRYAGLGSHRYPLGFSGDTGIYWSALNFQPYFTATATNAAYSWWSHDIGGHTMGHRDDDMYMRWLQLGVFSPIMRLHSSEFETIGKEPWKFKSAVNYAAKEWLRLRHKMIPYLFTMDYRTHEDGVALCEPMYYSYPDREEAYGVPNQFMFGSELMVCPITKPQHKVINMGSVDTWLPEGRWTDIFTGHSYEGGRHLTMFRDIDTIPVLAKEGAIVPLSADEGNYCGNPKAFEIWAFSGNGEFTLVEDNSRTDYAQHKATTKFTLSYTGDSVTFTIGKAEGDTSVLPETRDYKVVFKDLLVNGEPAVVELTGAAVNEEHTVTLDGVTRFPQPDAYDEAVRIASRRRTRTLVGHFSFKPFMADKSREGVRKTLEKCHLPKLVKLAIKEACDF